MNYAQIQEAFERRTVTPFKRDPVEMQLPRGNLFMRALAARVLASVRKTSALEVVRERYPNDRAAAEWIMRATAAPAMTGVAGWAAELVQTIIPDGLTV